MSPTQFKNAVDFAKKNPNDPRSQELRRRIEGGLMNPELTAAGMKTYEPPAPPKFDPAKVDMKAAVQPTTSTGPLQSMMPTDNGSIGSALMQAPGDIADTATKFVDKAGQRVQNVKDILIKGYGDTSASGTLEKSYQIAGQGAGLLTDALGALIEGGVRAVLPPEVEKNITDKGKELFATDGGKAALEAISQGVGAYNAFKEKHPEFAANLEATANIGNLLTMGIGGKAVNAAKDVAVDAAKSAVPVVKSAVETAVDTTKGAVSAAADARTAAKEAKATANATDAAGQLLQSKEPITPAQLDVLGGINKEGATDSATLAKRTQDYIDEQKKVVDNALASDTRPRKPNELIVAKDVKQGGMTSVAYSQPVKDAIKQLSEFYAKTGDTVDAEKMKLLETKLNSEGLTPQEINDLARKHGSDLNAYNANGELASGLSRQAAENTRQGLKDIVRQVAPETAATDKTISEAIKVKDLFEAQSAKEIALNDKLRKMGLLKRIGKALAESATPVIAGGAAGTAMAGPLGAVPGAAVGLIGNLLLKSFGASKTIPVDELKSLIPKNIETIDRLMKIKDKKEMQTEVDKLIQESQPTPTPTVDESQNPQKKLKEK